jgi:hypothetical protein
MRARRCATINRADLGLPCVELAPYPGRGSFAPKAVPRWATARSRPWQARGSTRSATIPRTDTAWPPSSTAEANAAARAGGGAAPGPGIPGAARPAARRSTLGLSRSLPGSAQRVPGRLSAGRLATGRADPGRGKAGPRLGLRDDLLAPCRAVRVRRAVAGGAARLHLRQRPDAVLLLAA